jgi:cytochrome c
MLKNIDLHDVSSLTYRLASLDKDGSIEVHLDKPKGDLISTISFQPTGAWNKFTEISAEISNPGGKHDLYFVFAKPGMPNKNIASIDWVAFEGGRAVEVKPGQEEKKLIKTTSIAGKTGAPQSVAPSAPVRKLRAARKKPVDESILPATGADREKTRL